MVEKFRLGNKEVTQILKEILAAMEVKDFNKFKIRAYQNAIASMEALTSSVFDMWQAGRLQEIPGVGGGLSQHLEELFTTGDVKEFKLTKQGLPDGMFGLIGIRGIGAKKAFKLATAFHLTKREEAVEKLKEFAEQGKIRELEGFGEKSEKDILDAISEAKLNKNVKQRMLLITAEDVADRICEYIKRLPGVGDVIALGSLRRRQPTVGDLDIVAVYEDGDELINHFLKFPEISEVVVQGDKKVTVDLTTGVQVDVRVATKEDFGSFVQYSTGNKQHNIELRTYALENGMSLSEYGIKHKGKLQTFATEEEFYKYLHLPCFPPELRQGKDEINLAIEGKLPKLVKHDDIKGDLHCHTIASDGLNTLSEMVNAGKELGYQYIGITDHAPSVLSRGFEEVNELIDRQRKNIEALDQAQKDIRVFFGYEVNILADCTLALPDEVLAKLDYVVASIHTSFNQPRELITERLIKAIENPYVTIIGHPTGRLINEREPVDADWTKVLDACLKHNKMLEINSQPNRLDLTEDLVYEARKRGIRLIINSDAHDTASLNFMKYGLDVARRGFCERKDIINTLSLEDLLALPNCFLHQK
ncbi:MAG: hypothetical protein ACD_22C00026G0002 [uncultured bacterium]|nr:MAG: hypothetical protein ACD_22C00026G0002 [uncultured bacterium]